MLATIENLTILIFYSIFKPKTVFDVITHTSANILALKYASTLYMPLLCSLKNIGSSKQKV